MWGEEEFFLEKHTVINESDAGKFHCPQSPAPVDKYCDQSCCVGSFCLAWIQEVNEEGTATGRGRCGMVVAPIIGRPTYWPQYTHAVSEKNEDQ